MRKRRRRIKYIEQLPEFQHVISESALDKNGKWIVRKSIQYLGRLLRMKVPVNYDAFNFICIVLGPLEQHLNHSLVSHLKDSRSLEAFLEDRKDAEDIDDMARLYNRYFFKLCKANQATFIKEILGLLEQRYSSLRYRGVSDIERHIKSMVKMFCLDEDEQNFYQLLFLHSISSKAESYFVDSLDVQSIMRRQHLCSMLDMTISQVKHALSGTLSTQEMMKHDRGYLCLTDEFMAFFEHSISTVQKKRLYCKIKGDILPLDYQLINAEDISHLHNLLEATSEHPTHILLYGEPGTGKSSFAEALAIYHTPHAFKILQGVGNDGRNRRSAIVACMNMTSAIQDRVIVVDDADNLLNTQDSWFSRGEVQDKGWLNLLMEKPRTKIIWVVNRIEDIEHSVIRRFAYSVQFKPFNRRLRVQLWEKILRKNKMKRFFSKADIKCFASKYKLNAGVVDLAVKKSSDIKIQSKQGIHHAVRLSLDAHLALMNEGGVPLKKERPVTHDYSLDGLNIKGDIEKTIGLLGSFCDFIEKNPNETLSMNLLFYGPSGTGKSELAIYIAHQLDREILRKRVSDLHDKYVGESEKNIRNAFRQAERDGAILIIDEADSLLYSRDKAQKSWEVSFTNEFLTQMEDFRGILICTTNRLKELDPASIRRFNHKLFFENLTPQGNVIFYKKLLAKLVDTSLSISQQDSLKTIPSLSPGDFKTVKEQYRFYPSNNLCHTDLLQALWDESNIKQKHKNKTPIGFV